MNIPTRNFRWWIPVLVWLGVIAVESFRLSGNVTGVWITRLLHLLHIDISARAVAELNHVLRKTGHVTGYGVLCLLAFRACFHTLASRMDKLMVASGSLANFLRIRSTVFALSITLVTAVLDEWHQSFDPSRTSSARDVGIDMTGAVVFLAFTLFVLKLWKYPPKASNQAVPGVKYFSPRA